MYKHVLFRIAALCVMVVLAVSASGCKDGKEDAAVGNGQAFELPFDDVTAFCVSPDGQVYFAVKDGDRIYRCDSEGIVNKEFELGSGDYRILSMWEDSLYAFDYNDCSLTKLNLSEGSSVEIETKEDLNFATSMVAVDDFLYLIVAGGNNRELEESSYSNEHNYIYGGERFIKLNLENGEITNLNMPFIKLITAGEGAAVRVYAYDTEKGFYFAVFDTENDSEGTRYYVNNNNLVISFAYDSKRDGYFYFDRDECVFAEAKDPELQKRFYSCKYAEKKIMPQRGGDIQVTENYMYMLNNHTESGPITRLEIDSYIKNTKEIVIYSTTMVETPEGLGYSVRKEYFESDGLAIKLMAGDSDYDILIIPTGVSILESIFTQGAYTTLSGEGIENYFNNARAPVKKAAETEEGYWMLPIQIWPTAVLYREDKCKEARLDMEGIDSIDTLFALRNRLLEYNDSPMYHTNFFAISPTMIYRILNSYHVHGIEASKEEFRKTALVLENYYQKNLEGEAIIYYPFAHRSGEEDSLSLKDLEKFTEENKRRQKEYYDSAYYIVENSKYDYRGIYLYNGGFSARELPPITAGSETLSPIDAEVMVMSPNSFEQETVIAYMNELAAVLIDDPSTFLSETVVPTDNMDKQLYSDLGKILDDGELIIDAPIELVADSLFAYLRDEISIDDAIEAYAYAISAYYEE